MKPTIVEVAREAGVSVGTASRALQGHPSVRGEKVALVQEAAQRLNYTPLRQRRSQQGASAVGGGEPHGPGAASVRRAAGELRGRRVALVLLGMDRSLAALPVVTEAIQGVEAALSRAGAEFLLADVPDLAAIPPVLRRGRVDAVILRGAMQGQGIAEAGGGDLMRRLATFPHLWLMGRPAGCSGDAVLADDWEVGRLAAEHLVNLGHRHLAFLNPKPDHALFLRREASFTFYARRFGAHSVRSFVGEHPESWTLPLRPVQSGEVLRDLIHNLLSATPRPTAVFLPADNITALAYREFGARGVTVGRDISVISCNNEQPLRAALFPALTTIDIHPQRIGERAVDHLASLLARGGGSPHGDVEVSLKPHLLVEDSVYLLK